MSAEILRIHPDEPQPDRIDYGPIAEAVKEIPRAICNHIDGERKAELERIHFALPAVTKWTVRVATRTFEGGKCLAGEDDREPTRRFHTVVCIPPLSRAILDNLFNLIFLYDRPQENTRWHLANAWRDARSAHEAMAERYRDDPEWAQYLPMYAGIVADMAKDASISPEESQNPDSVRKWPLPGAMKSGQAKGGVELTQDPSRRVFIGHLHKWYYGELSGKAHLSGMGFLSRGYMSFLTEETDETRQQVLLANEFFTLLTMHIALLSEVVGELKLFHEAVRLREIWKQIQRWPDAEDLFKQRYDSWLPGSPILQAKHVG